MKRLPLFSALAAALITSCSLFGGNEKDADDDVQPLTLEIEQLPEAWWHQAVVYEIWPRSFKDSDGDGHGDFKGIHAKLDYLSDLGADAIWLTPIFEAPSYHGYDFVSFTEVESDYGTMADFEAMMAAAQDRGIRIILDLVINHISDQHPWFIKSAAGEPGYEDYFLWSGERPEGWGKAWLTEPEPEAVWHWHEGRGAYYYGAFGPSQPDVNLNNPAVASEMEAMAKFWLDKGVDGFRLDAVRYAVEDMEPGDVDQADTEGTIAFWNAFNRFVKSVNPEALMVAEAWADMPTVAMYRDGGKGLDSSFEFDFGYVIIDLFAGGERVADFGNVGESEVKGRLALWNNLVLREAHAPMAYYAPFLTNHDQVRIFHSLQQDKARARVAASLLLTSPGSLYLYYGEEIGMTQDRTGDDTYKRAIMQWENTPTAGFNSSGKLWIEDPQWTPWIESFSPWWKGFWEDLRARGGMSVAEQQGDPGSLLHHYKSLIAARKSIPAIATPERLQFYPVKAESAWLLEYHAGEESALVIINLDPDDETGFDVPDRLKGQYLDKVACELMVLGKQQVLKPAAAHILVPLD